MRLDALLVICVLLASVCDGGAVMPWKGIVPLYSTRGDVEKILGIQSEGSGIDELEFDAQLVQIRYVTSSCPPNGTSKWRVPVGTVVSILVIPKKKTFLSDFNFDISRFKVTGTDEVNARIYTNVTDGVVFEISVLNEQIAYIYYVPTERDNILLCDSNSR